MPAWWKLAFDFGLALVGIRTAEEPPHEVLQRLSSDMEIRLYAPRLAAETAMASNSEEESNAAFRRLAGYIFGRNRGKSDIAMTAPVETGVDIAMTVPVETQTGIGAAMMRFFLPAGMQAASAPVPDDDKVMLRTVPAQKLAVIRFSGSSGPEQIARKTDALKQMLAANAVRQAGEARLYRYDPPSTPPFLRRNEVVIPVE